ncbi:MAG: hypothetical protein ACTSUE_14460 [Promethearchaeota archaeon]
MSSIGEPKRVIIPSELETGLYGFPSHLVNVSNKTSPLAKAYLNVLTNEDSASDVLHNNPLLMAILQLVVQPSQLKKYNPDPRKYLEWITKGMMIRIQNIFNTCVVGDDKDTIIREKEATEMLREIPQEKNGRNIALEWILEDWTPTTNELQDYINADTVLHIPKSDLMTSRILKTYFKKFANDISTRDSNVTGYTVTPFALVLMLLPYPWVEAFVSSLHVSTLFVTNINLRLSRGTKHVSTTVVNNTNHSATMYEYTMGELALALGRPSSFMLLYLTVFNRSSEVLGLKESPLFQISATNTAHSQSMRLLEEVFLKWLYSWDIVPQQWGQSELNVFDQLFALWDSGTKIKNGFRTQPVKMSRSESIKGMTSSKEHALRSLCITALIRFTFDTPKSPQNERSVFVYAAIIPPYSRLDIIRQIAERATIRISATPLRALDALVHLYAYIHMFLELQNISVNPVKASVPEFLSHNSVRNSYTVSPGSDKRVTLYHLMQKTREGMAKALETAKKASARKIQKKQQIRAAEFGTLEELAHREDVFSPKEKFGDFSAQLPRTWSNLSEVYSDGLTRTFSGRSLGSISSEAESLVAEKLDLGDYGWQEFEEFFGFPNQELVGLADFPNGNSDYELPSLSDFEEFMLDSEVSPLIPHPRSPNKDELARSNLPLRLDTPPISPQNVKKSLSRSESKRLKRLRLDDDESSMRSRVNNRGTVPPTTTNGFTLFDPLHKVSSKTQRSLVISSR